MLGLGLLGLFQIRAFGAPAMKRRYHFGNATSTAPKEMARISSLISDLDRRAQLLECDIAAEEKRARVFSRSDDAYPITARILAVRRDNLKATIAALEQRLARLQGAEKLPA
jgi:predicted kinase